jgi:hypothetical protein
LAEPRQPPVETERQIYKQCTGTALGVARSSRETIRRKEVEVNESTRDKEKVPPPVISNPPERETEQKLKKDPGNEDAKVDLGSDESMDASDPPTASQPGSAREPAPSSGFPDKKDR